MTANSYLTRATEIIKKYFVSDDPTGSMTAAKVGVILRRHLGSPDEGGFFKLKDLLQEVERQGVIQTGFNSKDAFAFWLGNDRRVVGNQAIVANRNVAGPIRRLRQPVWYAFVAESQEGDPYLNKQTGEVKTASSDEPRPPEDWVRIKPIPTSVEKDEAKRFLELHDVELNDDINRALESKIWFVELPKVLEREMAFKWKRHRTGRVVEHVEEWRQENGIDHRLVYDAKPSKRPEDAPRDAHRLRTLLLASIARMSDEELLSLSIPAKHLIVEIRPDLLSR